MNPHGKGVIKDLVENKNKSKVCNSVKTMI
jgi:hypothetical protein